MRNSLLALALAACAGRVDTVVSVDEDGRRTTTYASTRQGLGVGREDPPTVAAAANATNAYAEAGARCLGAACQNGLVPGYGYGMVPGAGVPYAGGPAYPVGGYTAAGAARAVELQLLSPAPQYTVIQSQGMGDATAPPAPPPPVTGGGGGGGGGAVSPPAPAASTCPADAASRITALKGEISAELGKASPDLARLEALRIRAEQLTHEIWQRCKGSADMQEAADELDAVVDELRTEIRDLRRKP